MKPEQVFCYIIGVIAIWAGIALWLYMSSHGCQLHAHCP